MAAWGWARLLPVVLGEDALGRHCRTLKRLVDELSARPAGQRAVALKDRHAFKAEMDADAMKNMFPSIKTA